jgi:hypothetical protein
MDLFSLPPLSKNRNPSTGIKWNLLPVIGTVYHVELGRHKFVCVSVCACLCGGGFMVFQVICGQ